MMQVNMFEVLSKNEKRTTINALRVCGLKNPQVMRNI